MAEHVTRWTCLLVGMSMFLWSAGAGAGVAPPLEALLSSVDAGDLRPLESARATVEDPATRAVIDARSAASRLDLTSAEQALAIYFALHDDDPQRRKAALAVAAEIAFIAGRYTDAERALSEMESLLGAEDEEEVAGLRQFRVVTQQLRTARPQRVDGSVAYAAIPTVKDKVGLTRADFWVQGKRQQAVIDTGANLSVVTATVAGKLGLRILEGPASIRSATRENVPVRLAVAEELEIAGTRLSNVVFLVLDDKQLELPVPGGYRIDAIIGYPVLRALGRIRFGIDGTMTVLPPGPSSVSLQGNLRAIGNDLFVETVVGGSRIPLHLDTGASSTTLFARFAKEQPAVVARLKTRSSSVASAGGAIKTTEAVWENVPVTLADGRTVLPGLPIETSSARVAASKFYGTLGKDVLEAFDSYTIDFNAMRLEVGAPLRAPGQATADVRAAPDK